jgi:hypothetical protein
MTQNERERALLLHRAAPHDREARIN